MVNWKDPEAMPRLLAAIIASQEGMKLNYLTIATLYGHGATKDSIDNKLRGIKILSATLKSDLENGTTPAEPDAPMASTPSKTGAVKVKTAKSKTEGADGPVTPTKNGKAGDGAIIPTKTTKAKAKGADGKEKVVKGRVVKSPGKKAAGAKGRGKKGVVKTEEAEGDGDEVMVDEENVKEENVKEEPVSGDEGKEEMEFEIEA